MRVHLALAVPTEGAGGRGQEGGLRQGHLRCRTLHKCCLNFPCLLVFFSIQDIVCYFSHGRHSDFCGHRVRLVSAQ